MRSASAPSQAPFTEAGSKNSKGEVMSDARMRILFRRIKSIAENGTIQLNRSIEDNDMEEVKRVLCHLEAIKHLAEEIIE